MFKGVEIDFVVYDVHEALALYEKIFHAKVVEKTNGEKGSNEAVFTIQETRFHILDENPHYMLFAPKKDQPKTMWMNMIVDDIHESFQTAISLGCQIVQEVMCLEEMGISNAMFLDPFGYIWMLHQVHREVSFEERCRIMEEKMQ